ncbi:hypothetical protein HID58_069508, partial [Brassica napus]
RRQSFSFSVAETEMALEEEDGCEDIGATVVCSCETLANHLTNCGFQSTPRVTSSCTSCKAAVEVDRPDQPSRIKEIAFKKQTELEDIYARSHVEINP